MEAGQQYLQEGRNDLAVEHLVAAISVYPNQAALLPVLQKNIPPDVFAQLVRRLSTLEQERQAARAAAAAAAEEAD
eukprot:UC1_evm1s1723